MHRCLGRWSVTFGLLCLGLASSPGTAAPPVKPTPPASGVEAVSAQTLAARIDTLIEARWKANKIKEAARSSDAEFVRRIYLDLMGRIPRVSEMHDFLDDRSPNKREKLINRLLDSPTYALHFANVWRSVMVPQSTDQLVQAFAPQMELWLSRRLKQNMSYDQMVREILTAPLFNRVRQPGQQQGQPQIDPSVVAFYQANESKPETIAAATSRIFLGVRLECAQCHDHPFNAYTRQQFWEYAAFFAGIQPNRQMGNRFIQAMDDPSIHEISIPGTEKKVQARYLDGKEPKWDKETDARKLLADWMTTPQNPYFAKATVNRMWAYFFGVGIIDPVDEPSADNPPSHPELLAELSTQFALNKFDLKYLIKAITLSRTYQLTSIISDASQEDVRLFARMNVKGLSPEQLFDSISLATGFKDPNGFRRRGGFRGVSQAETEFRTRFSNFSDRRTEFQTSILQALSMMNGQFVTDATSLSKSQTLASVADSPFMDTRAKLDALYLATLSRSMKSEEAARLIKFVNSGGPSGDSNKALADVFWTLLNSSEFMFNH